MSESAICARQHHRVVQRERVAERAEADVARPLRHQREQLQRIGHDRELLEPGVLQAGEDVEPEPIGLDADLDVIPHDLGVVAVGLTLELRVGAEAKGHRLLSWSVWEDAKSATDVRGMSRISSKAGHSGPLGSVASSSTPASDSSVGDVGAGEHRLERGARHDLGRDRPAEQLLVERDDLALRVRRGAAEGNRLVREAGVAHGLHRDLGDVCHRDPRLRRIAAAVERHRAVGVEAERLREPDVHELLRMQDHVLELRRAQALLDRALGALERVVGRGRRERDEHDPLDAGGLGRGDDRELARAVDARDAIGPRIHRERGRRRDDDARRPRTRRASVSGCSMSPSKQRTPSASRRARAAGSDVLRTSARTCSPRARSRWQTCSPSLPVAPTTTTSRVSFTRLFSHRRSSACCISRARQRARAETHSLTFAQDTGSIRRMPDASPLHPLDPLSAEEMAAAMATLRRERPLSERTLVISIALVEPDKATLRAHAPGDAVARTAAIVLVDCVAETTCEATVSISDDRLLEFRVVEGQQAAIIGEEYEACEQLVKAHPDFAAALARRGITDQTLVCVDPIPAGTYVPAELVGRRICRGLVWRRPSPGASPYGQPIEGIVALVDLNRREVIRIDDYGVVPVPSSSGEYRTGMTGPEREGVRPIEVVQPEGAELLGRRQPDHAGRAGRSAPAGRCAKASSCTSSPTTTATSGARSCTARRSARWRCPTAIRARRATSSARSTSART